MSGVPPAARARLAQWLADCAADPTRLPDGVRGVQSRLVRIVGCGELPGLGTAYLKLMAFPRGKDRLRYAFRALPAEHEAGLLRRLAAADATLAVPEPLAVLARRRRGLPWVSVLVTRALPLAVDGPPASLAEAAELASRLARLGLFHPDLQAKNLPRLADGRLGLLDLQSARWGGRALGARERLRMAEKLAAEHPGEALEPLADAGLVTHGELAQLARAAEAQRAADLERRIRRCWTTSTEFIARRSLAGAEYRRRASAGDAAERLVLSGGRELRALWLGDRACEILDGSAPSFVRLCADPWWLGGRHRLYISEPGDVSVVDRRRSDLLDGCRRWRRLRATSQSFGAHAPHGTTGATGANRAAGTTVGSS